MWRLDVSSEAELEIFEAALRYEREREGTTLVTVASCCASCRVI
jgi:hypothetical protein